MEKVVIVVEDDEIVRLALRLSLEDIGYSVIAGSSVEIVAAMLSLKKSLSCIDLSAVIADFRLNRGITGITAIHCLEKLCNRGFRRVLITGDIDPDIPNQARSAGLTLLRKPFRFEDLLTSIEPAIQASSHDEALGALRAPLQSPAHQEQ